MLLDEDGRDVLGEYTVEVYTDDSMTTLLTDGENEIVFGRACCFVGTQPIYYI